MNWEQIWVLLIFYWGRGVASLAQPSYRPRQQHKFSLPLTQFLSTHLLSQIQIQIQIQIQNERKLEKCCRRSSLSLLSSSVCQAPPLPMTSDIEASVGPKSGICCPEENILEKLVDHLVAEVLMLTRWKYLRKVVWAYEGFFFRKVGWSSCGGSAASSACACPRRTHPHLTSLAAPHTERRELWEQCAVVKTLR